MYDFMDWFVRVTFTAMLFVLMLAFWGGLLVAAIGLVMSLS